MVVEFSFHTFVSDNIKLFENDRNISVGHLNEVLDSSPGRVVGEDFLVLVEIGVFFLYFLFVLAIRHAGTFIIYFLLRIEMGNNKSSGEGMGLMGV